jgi:hypothetical protein
MANTTTTSWSTLHIFGYGETQLIGADFNKKVPSSVLTTLQAVVDNIYSFKPVDNPATTDYHAINIFNTLFADWQTKEQEIKGWRTIYSELNVTLINALIEEIVAYSEPTITLSVEQQSTTSAEETTSSEEVPQ